MGAPISSSKTSMLVFVKNPKSIKDISILPKTESYIAWVISLIVVSIFLVMIIIILMVSLCFKCKIRCLTTSKN